MPNSRSDNLRLIKIFSVSILVLAISIFVFFRSLSYFKGPYIEIHSPSNGLSTTSPVIEIAGQALRINKITLNNNPIYIDENGNWREVIVIFPGLNLITVKVEDQFGRIVSKQLDIVGQTNQ